MASNGSGSKRLRTARRAMRRMEPFDRAIFLAIRFDNASYEELAERYDVGIEEIEKAFARAIDVLITTPPPPWWQIWLY